MIVKVYIVAISVNLVIQLIMEMDNTVSIEGKHGSSTSFLGRVPIKSIADADQRLGSP